MNSNRSVRKAVWAALTGLIVVGVGACSTIDGILDVNNPEELDEGLLNDSTLVGVLLNGVIGDFQDMYSDPFIWRGSMFTDEQVTGINWEQTARLNQRIIQFDEGDADLMFSALSRARQQADTLIGRLQGGLSSSPTDDPRLATAFAYAGYSYIVLGDAMCEATVNVGAEIYEPLELYQFAVDRFLEGLPIAAAAGETELVDLMNVGLSRAYLNLGQSAEAMAAAALVPTAFVKWVEYSETDDRTYNILEARVTGANHALGVHPTFVAGGPSNFGTQDLDAMLTDPRVQHEPSWQTGHNALTQLYRPKSGLMFSNYNGETFAAGGDPAVYLRGTDIAMASYVEAMHNYYEAAGPSGTGPLGTTLDFVNARRAVGNEGAVSLTGDALMDELRFQRGKDLFMAGYRLGDLRRWLRQGDDLFPSGAHVNDQWGDYGTATCFPLPKEEFEGNPNIGE